MADSIASGFDVFISYSSHNRDWVETLAQNLDREGYRVFFDKWVMAGGQFISDVLDRALEGSQKSILVVTPESQSSGWVKTEYRKMVSRQNREPDFVIVPIILAGQASLAFLDNIVQIDFRESSAYRVAFHRLVCGLEGRSPGKGPAHDFAPNLRIPTPIPTGDTGICGTKEGMVAFVERLFSIFHQNPTVALLAQAGRYHGALDQEILNRAEENWGCDRVRRILLPYSSNSNTKQLFQLLGQQCGFSQGTVTSNLTFQAALGRELKKGPLFLMVTGMENASDQGQKDLAGVLRALSDQYRDSLKLVICGGEKLANLKYAGGEHSLLNHAEEMRCPELTVADVLNIAVKLGAATRLCDADAQEILTLTGGHPDLVIEALRIKQRAPDISFSDLSDELALSSTSWQFFIPFGKNPDKTKAVCHYLETDDLGPYRPFVQDTTLSELYWKNLVAVRQKNKKRRFVWRSPLLQQVGKEILQEDK